MAMPGRQNTNLSNSESYRYAYNGMEQDNEVSGNGNSYTTEFRQYDPRLGRWKSLDPLMSMFPHMSPYVAFDNNPIYYIDPYGLASTNGDEGLGDRRGGPGMMGDGGGDKLTHEGWETTLNKTSEKEGIGGMVLHIPLNGKKITPIKDYNDDKTIGFPNGTPYKNAKDGQVFSFYGDDNKEYSARFSKSGDFLGYWTGKSSNSSPGESEYENVKIDDNKILEDKAEQGFKYTSDNDYRSTFNAPIFDRTQYTRVNNSFSLGGEKFNGQIRVFNRTFLDKNQPAYTLDFLYIHKGSVDGYQNSSTSTYTVAFFSEYTEQQTVPVFAYEFTSKAEWKRFVTYLSEKYGVNDGTHLVSRSLYPSQVIGK